MKYNILIILLLCGLSVHGKDTLRVGYYPSPPFVIKQNNHIEGVNMWLWQKIAENNDIPYELVELPLDKLLEGLTKNEIDVSLIPLTITSKRIKSIDFTPPYYMTNSGLLTLKEASNESVFKWMLGIWTFKFIKSIGALFLIVFIFGFLLWIFERKKNEEEFGNNLKGVYNGIWWSAVTMTTVGYGDKSPKTAGGRVVAIVWMFVAIMIISGFTASITSSLTVNNLNANKSSISEFKKKKIGVLKGSATEYWLTSRFYSNITTHPNIKSSITALNNKEIDAIAYGKPILKTIIQQNPENNYELLDFDYNHQMYSFGLSESLDTKIKKQIKYSLLVHIDTKDWNNVLSEYQLLKSDEE